MTSGTYKCNLKAGSSYKLRSFHYCLYCMFAWHVHIKMTTYHIQGRKKRWKKGHIWQRNMTLFGSFLEDRLSSLQSHSFSLRNIFFILHSDQGGQLVYEIINSVDHKLDVVLLGHAVLTMSSKDDIHIVAEDTFRNLHGDVPGDVLIFKPMNEPYRTGDWDGTMKHTVIFCFMQKVQANPVKSLLWVFGGHCPFPFVLELLAGLHIQIWRDLIDMMKHVQRLLQNW